jgi:uncharacterized protein (DUF4415 family)
MRIARKLSSEEKAALDALSGTPDLTDPDAPEVTSWEHALRGGLYCPVKRPVTMRLDADILEWFRSRHAKDYLYAALGQGELRPDIGLKRGAAA